MSQRFAEVIKTEEQLRDVLGHPAQQVLDKVVTRIDRHCRSVIENSPFMLIATADAAGNMDVSPKGDPAGFVKVLDDTTLAIPDRKGNRRADTFTNILQNPKVGLFFLVPGFRETLRVTGTAHIVRDTELREDMAVKGSVPELAIVVDVVDAFFHCAKCVIRSGLWQQDDWPDVEHMPHLGEVIADHSKVPGPIAQLNEQVEESYVKNLY